MRHKLIHIKQRISKLLLNLHDKLQFKSYYCFRKEDVRNLLKFPQQGKATDLECGPYSKVRALSLSCFQLVQFLFHIGFFACFSGILVHVRYMVLSSI